MGHTVHKCYKVHGYPPGYKQSTQGNFNQGSRPPATFIPPGPTSFTPRPPPVKPENVTIVNPQQRTVANVFSGTSSTGTMPYYPPPVTNMMHLDISQLSSDQIQTLVNQLSTHVRPPEPPAPISHPSITETGVMASSISMNVVSVPATKTF